MLLICSITLFAQNNTPVLKTSLDSFSYAMGMSLGNYCNQQGVKKVNTNVLARGASDAIATGKTLLTEQQMNQLISGYIEKSKNEKLGETKLVGEKFLAANSKKAGIVTLPSGLQYQVIRQGKDTVRPEASDRVKVHYHGTLIDGTVFDSSVERGTPAVFGVTQVIRGWVEALQLMTPGAKWRLYIPSGLAYGDRQSGPKIPGGSALIFDVELLEIVK